MFRLTREVRFAVNLRGQADDPQLADGPTNSFGGFPSVTGLAIFLAARVTLRGPLDPTTQYLVNIKEIDELLRSNLRSLVRLIRNETPTPPALLRHLNRLCHDRWGDRVESVALAASPLQHWSLHRNESPMIRLSQKFEFSASHRLHSPALSDEENRKCFGKCNNPAGHGHNYELEVTLSGEPDATGLLCDIPTFERIVAETVIEPFDHKNLNAEVQQFRDLMPSVENIAMVIFRLLKPRFASARSKLASVTVWETPKTWCEYAE
jgi:6-pyruvoyltetrahydropterin/6-carboxytetrahydropterin synthase